MQGCRRCLSLVGVLPAADDCQLSPLWGEAAGSTDREADGNKKRQKCSKYGVHSNFFELAKICSTVQHSALPVRATLWFFYQGESWRSSAAGDTLTDKNLIPPHIKLAQLSLWITNWTAAEGYRGTGASIPYYWYYQNQVVVFTVICWGGQSWFVMPLLPPLCDLHLSDKADCDSEDATQFQWKLSNEATNWCQTLVFVWCTTSKVCRNFSTVTWAIRSWTQLLLKVFNVFKRKQEIVFI